MKFEAILSRFLAARDCRRDDTGVVTLREAYLRLTADERKELLEYAKSIKKPKSSE